MALNISAIDGLHYTTLSNDQITTNISKIESEGGLIVYSEALFDGKHKIGWWNGQDTLSINKYHLEELVKLLSQNGIRISQGVPSGTDQMAIKLEKMTQYTVSAYKTSSMGEILHEGVGKGKRASKSGYTLL